MHRRPARRVRSSAARRSSKMRPVAGAIETARARSTSGAGAGVLVAALVGGMVVSISKKSADTEAKNSADQTSNAWPRPGRVNVQTVDGVSDADLRADSPYHHPLAPGDLVNGTRKDRLGNRHRQAGDHRAEPQRRVSWDGGKRCTTAHAHATGVLKWSPDQRTYTLGAIFASGTSRCPRLGRVRTTGTVIAYGNGQKYTGRPSKIR